MSGAVQASLSLQAVPSSLAGSDHTTVALSHVPASWHWSSALHTTGLSPVHTPVWQVSTCVHASLSLHGVLSSLAGSEHTPVALSHVPASWHWSSAEHTTGSSPV